MSSEQTSGVPGEPLPGAAPPWHAAAPAESPSFGGRSPEQASRRAFLFKVSLFLNGIVGAVFAVPILGYFLGPAFKRDQDFNSWISLGAASGFPEGETRLVNYRNPVTTAGDGETGNVACWVRHIQGGKFQVFAINCAHLGCPVRWFAQAQLFMCPCHGGAYYADGSRASGPPERGLFEYQYSIEQGNLLINAGQMPTLSNVACNRKGLVQIQQTSSSETVERPS
jgi:quinol---cytochrome c reductase iron-sulfur subunit, bacillus type